jgi:hypothetical protein
MIQKQKVHYIKYSKIIRKSVKEANTQHYIRLTARSNDKIKQHATLLKKKTGKLHSVEQVPTLLVNDEKQKDLRNVTTAFNNLFMTITQNLETNSSIRMHNINTRNKHRLHRRNANHLVFKAVHFMLAAEFSTFYQLALKSFRMKRQKYCRL